MVFVVGSSRLAAQDAPPPALDPDLVALAANPDAGLVDAWVIFAAQPATQIAAELRPEYERLLESARAPALAALDRIDPLLPPREERGALGVAGIMQRERALLTDAEVDAIRAARDDTRRIVQEMRARTLETARPLCESEQAPVVAWIEALPGGEVRTRTVVLDALIVRAPASALPELARQFPGIARITRSGKFDADLSISVPTIGASNWTSAGYAGAGATVSVVDSGVDASHPALTTSSSTAVVAASTVKLSNGSSASDFSDNASSTDDLQGHGTHCAGIVASNDSTYTGVAPGTSLLNAKCFYKTTSNGASANGNDIVAAVDWSISNGADVLSCSFGGSGTNDGSSGLSVYFDAVVDVSAVSAAIAAGNSGSTIDLPGDCFNCVTVGAFDHAGTTTLSDDSLAYYSGRGPTTDGRRKPDLCAPGGGGAYGNPIMSCNNAWEGGTYFVGKSGTSMATPHVAGSMALLLSYLSPWKPAALKALLANSCRNSSPVTGTPDSNWGCGALDLGPAYSDRTRVLTPTLTTSGPTALYYKLGSVASGARQTIAWNRAASYYSGTNPASGPGSTKTLVNLDLFLYDGSNGSQVASSASTVDSLEQTKAASAVTNGVLKVLRAGSFPSGKTSQDFALATGANTATLANPPTLAFTATTAPTDVAGSATFTFTATIRNTGDLRAPTPSLTLTLPTGFSFASGVNATQSVSSLDPFATAGATQTASWSVVSGTSSGVKTFSVAATCSGYGTTFPAATPATRNVTVDATAPTANAGVDISLPATSAAGRSITLDGSGSTDNSGQTLTYAWDTDGDGDFTDSPGSATGVTPTVVFPIGTRTVTLRVTDYVGNVGTDTLVVAVTNAPPVANAGPDKSSNEGSSVSFDGTGSSDVEGPIASYSWNFGDGSAAASGATPSHVFRNNGVYTVTLTVTDSVGQIATDTAVVTVANVAPTANAGPAKSGNEGSAITLSGSATDPGLDDVLTYSWTFGDGGTGTGATPSHVYRNNGVYTATLTVTDGDGGSGSSTTQVTVANVPPTANAGPPKNGNEGSAISFTGSATDPGLDDVLTYSWDFGDGTPSANAASTSHVYAQNGVYTATLTARDGDGGVGSSTTQVTVANVAPTANAGGDEIGDEGSTISFGGSATDPGVLDVLTYAWDFGDGGTATGASASHVYARHGSYTATLTVSDGDGGVGTSVAHVTVRNVAPVADAGADASSNEGDAVQFAGTATDAGALDVLTYAWDFGDGSGATTAGASHVYVQDGVYVATLTATDDAGAASTSTRTITVANVAPQIALPESLEVDVGAVFHLHLAPTDASPVDAANLAVSWKIVDAAEATVASGVGVDAAWSADRAFEGALVVDVADDHVATHARTPLFASVPPIGETLPATLVQDLAPGVERTVLLDVVAARNLAQNPKKLRGAAKKLAAAKALLARKGVASGPLVARLAVLSAACAAGTEPPAEHAFDVPETPGTIDDLLSEAPRAGFPAPWTPRLLSKLVALRYAERLGAAKRVAAAKKAAAAVAFKLPAGAAHDWFYESILAQ
jgi:PKD repeat protein